MSSCERKPETVPRALREVWDWKEAVYEGVKHLPPEEAVRAILAKAAATVRKHNVWAESTPARVPGGSPRAGS
jgi:hypothetical protein